jgi:hypothetical protein
LPEGCGWSAWADGGNLPTPADDDLWSKSNQLF